ncbi:UDP-glucose/GDP-mannose dehydrogenase family protein [Roseomonas genomospecies 6]|uniref:UDP-glucose 6-dehydrogenase n=1 Tax=Roseomonas genomospecies 6 TaxID=214106 RepID=A0A9W7KNJ1_9PROT|nr:nucleotide sugar dehydrogenase [Roseomonas genomospecies 6]KAA0676217.1 UDP-glucose/GDP-mannose dehydrogenase family protein [Roseomonas genomospecies 6]
MRVSVVGLGKLGSPLAAVLAYEGNTVIGVDVNEEFVAAINEGRAPVKEPGLQELIDRNRSRLRATTSFDEAVAGSDVSFVILPTPSLPNGLFTNEYVLAAMESIGSALRAKDGYHLVVITSTVVPGSTGGCIRQALERASQRRLGDTLGLCYSPEFIALGSVVRDLLNPDFALIGESDAKAGDVLEGIYRGMTANTPVVRRMNFVNAELTKISVNTFVTTKITYANMVAELCDHLPGADVDVVTQAIGSDSRIGQKYLRGALGYGGPCFPRDNRAFAALARSAGMSADIAEATDRINDRQVDRVIALTTRHVRPRGKVAVLGLSYKPDTMVVEESQGVKIAQALHRLGYDVVAYDPMADVRSVLATEAAPAASMAECVDGADAIVISTPWPEFRGLRPALCADGQRVVVVDCWRQLDPAACAGTTDVIHLGFGLPPESIQMAAADD